MWLFTKDSFVSIVQHRTQPNTVLVRARRKIDIERLFPDKAKHIRVDGLADYPYRLFVSKLELSRVLKNYIENDLTYDNFKSAQDKTPLASGKTACRDGCF